MSIKKHLAETLTLIAAAVLCALIANALARSERRLKLPGDYPNALQVPAAAAATPAPAVVTPVPSAVPIATPSTAAPTAVAATAARPAPTAAARPAPPKPDLSRFAPHKDKAYVELHGDDVAALFAGGALFVDARRSQAYREGHVPGARGMSPWEADVDEKVTQLVNEGRDMQQPVVVYCTGGDCEDSHMLSQKLWGVGFENVYVYKDGWPDWQKRGGRVERGQ